MHTLTRVTILGGNPMVREGLHRILTDGDFDVCQSVADQSGLSDEGSRGSDLLVMIEENPELDGAGAIRSLRQRYPAVDLVVLSGGFDFSAMAAAFRAGVRGYLVKEISSESLIASLRLVVMGEKVMPSGLVDAIPLLAEDDDRDSARLLLESAHLSARERDILACLVIGCSNKVISRRLAITEATVKVHVKAILRKLRVKNRTQAAIRGINGGLGYRSAEPVEPVDTAVLVNLVANGHTPHIGHSIL